MTFKKNKLSLQAGFQSVHDDVFNMSELHFLLFTNICAVLKV